MITRHQSDNVDAIIKQLIMETPRKNVNKDGICLLGSRPIDPTKDAEMKLKCQKYSENSKEMTFFSDVLCLSRPCLEAMCIFVRARN